MGLVEVLAEEELRMYMVVVAGKSESSHCYYATINLIACGIGEKRKEFVCTCKH